MYLENVYILRRLQLLSRNKVDRNDVIFNGNDLLTEKSCLRCRYLSTEEMLIISVGSIAINMQTYLSALYFHCTEIPIYLDVDRGVKIYSCQ